MENSLINACIQLYKRLPKSGKPTDKEWTIISAIVGVFNNVEIKVLSLGTGSKCIGKSSMSSKGDILNDSHAEVIARRAFLKYLYSQIIQLNSDNHSEIFYKDQDENFHVKCSVKFYFVTGMSPCGDASIIPKNALCMEDNDSIGYCLETIFIEGAANNLKRIHSHEEISCKKFKVDSLDENEIKEDIHRTGAKCLPESQIQDRHLPGTLYHNTGAVRTKPGRGDPTLSLSCSDKIARWNAVGWQGALLSFFIKKPVFVEAIICGGNTPFSKTSFDRAVNERIHRETFIPIYQSDIVFPDIKTTDKRPCPSSIIWTNSGKADTEVSINGRKLGVTKKNLYKKTARTSICKKELFLLFEKAVNSLNDKDKFLHDRIVNMNNKSLKDLTYGELKSQALNYQREWKMVKEKYFKVWANKPPDLLNFTLAEQ